ncbi:MAG: hypothetical protein EB829_01365 [Nitrosopumilus sp. H8]|nr:MAG: hypothetical protein EB829_01365 [Nitrosopumilus sp. H8]
MTSFGRIFYLYDNQDVDSFSYFVITAAAVITGMLIFLASWLIFLLADMSRLKGMCVRLASPLVRNQAAPTRMDVAFVGLLVVTGASSVYFLTWTP